MPQLLKAQYQKEGATFANGDAAKADKNSLYTALETQQVQDTETNALASGFLLEPYVYVWDQETFVLSVNKLVTSRAEYNTEIVYDREQIIASAAAAGWTFLGTIVEEVA